MASDHSIFVTSHQIMNQDSYCMVTALTALVNLLMNDHCPPSVIPVLFGGRLIALQKKCGGIRPIAIGYTWRRLAAKCANKHALTQLSGKLAPFQLGVGTPGGCEAAVHATRRFLVNLTDDSVLVKLDFSNAFNSIRRDVFLIAAANTVPDICHFCLLANQPISILKYGSMEIESQEGAQQGDPLGPLLFCLGIQSLLTSLASNLAFGYLDDVTLGGPIATVASDVETIISKCDSLGLHLNPSKCEVISKSGAIHHPTFDGFRQIQPDSATLLGSPLSGGSAMEAAISTSFEKLSHAVQRLQLISSHDALVLLKNCLGGPKLQHVLRTSPCCEHPQLFELDKLLRSAITQICNVSLSDDQWLKPVCLSALVV
jgi:hypothetical protein